MNQNCLATGFPPDLSARAQVTAQAPLLEWAKLACISRGALLLTNLGLGTL